MDRERDMARLRAAANNIAAEYGTNEALRALDRVKDELLREQWGKRP